MLTREMKDSGVEWIGEIPNTWKMLKLKHIAGNFYSGGTPTASNDSFYTNSSEGSFFINISDMSTEKYVYSAVKRITDQGILDKNLKLVPKGSLLYGMYASVGVVSTLMTDSYISQAILSFEIKNEKLRNFVRYYLEILRDNISFYTSGTTQQNVNAEIVKNYPIVIPDSTLEIQKIVKYIESNITKIEKMISDTKQSIEELKKYKQSIITEAVTKGLNPNVKMKDSGIKSFGEIPVHWKMDKVRNLFTLNKGLTITKSDLKEEGIPVISYGEIHSKYGFRFDLKKHPVMKVNEKYIETNKDAIIKQGDFVFADTSEDIDGSGNFTCYVSDGLCFAGYHTVVLKSKNEINHNYFAYLFDSLAFRSQIQQRVQGIKVFSITQRILKPLQVILPSQQEQKEIVNYLDKQMESINQLIKDKSLFIEELEQYKKSLIFEYVTGKKQV